MRPRLVLASVACLFVACGGSAFNSVVGGPSDGGEAGSGADSSADSSSGGGGDATAESSGGGGDGAASDTGKPDGSVDGSGGGDATSLEGSSVEGGMCADISGGYGQISATGLGCGDLNTLATECIVLAQEICAFQLTSPATALPPAVNGLVILQSDGSFANADLQLGTVKRSGCLGQWAPGTQTLTLDCGGKGTGQSCVVTMVRKGPTCK